MCINKVYIGGVMAHEPYFARTPSNKDVLMIQLDINNSMDEVQRMTCYVCNLEMMNDIVNFVKQGDYLLCKGHINTLDYMYKQKLHCNNCNKTFNSERHIKNSMNIIIDEFHSFEGISLQKSIGLNKVVIFGKIDSTPKMILKRKASLSYVIANVLLERPKYMNEIIEYYVKNSLAVKFKDYFYPTIIGYKDSMQKIQEASKINDVIAIGGSIQDGSEKMRIPIRHKENEKNAVSSLLIPINMIVTDQINPPFSIHAQYDFEFDKLFKHYNEYSPLKQTHNQKYKNVIDSFDFKHKN